MSLKLLNGGDKFFLTVGTGAVPNLRPDCDSGRQVWFDNNVHFWQCFKIKYITKTKKRYMNG